MRPQSDNWDVSYSWVNCDLCGDYIGGESWGRNDIIFAVCPLCSDSLGWPYPEFEDDEDDYDYDYDGYCEECGQSYIDCGCDDEEENDPQRELGGE